MKTYSQEELVKIIADHKLWLDGKSSGVRANLYGANLYGANLYGANLYGANLYGANLYGANLYGANLYGANGNSINIKSIQTNNWSVAYTDTVMQIGCQRHEISVWWKFDDEEIESMSGGALEWWKIWKPILKKIIKVSPAEPTGYIANDESK